MGREKSELRAQFALEIESARSQLSERESVLIEDHTITLEKIKEKYEKGSPFPYTYLYHSFLFHIFTMTLHCRNGLVEKDSRGKSLISSGRV